MKKLLTPLLVIVFFVSCTNEDVIDQQDALFSTSFKGGGADITIEPSGDVTGVTDANNIEIALTALPSGGTMLLETGTFHINRTLSAPTGFNGILIGKGMDDTEVIGVGDNFTPFSIVNANSSAFYFSNPKGTVTIASLTISLPDNFVTNEFNSVGNILGNFITVDLGNNQSDTNFNNLRLTGSAITNSFFLNQPFFGIQVIGNGGTSPPYSSGGTHTVTNSEISKIGFEVLNHQALKNATLRIKQNTFFEIQQMALRLLDGCDIIISNNNIDASEFGALVITQEGLSIPGKSNTVEIKNNIISTSGFMAIEIGSVLGADDADFELSIKNNQLSNFGPGSFIPSFAVIGIFEGNANADIKNNIILGNSDYGIYQESDEGSFKQNDLTDFNAILFDYGLLGNNNEIKGIGNSTVDDQGTGNTIKN